MTTENRDYNVPEPGEENWHEPVNENWELIDADVQAALDAAESDDGGASSGGLTPARTNVGALVGGTYHDSTYPDGGYGVVFEASDLHIDSVVVDSNLDAVSNPDLTIELRRFEGGATDPAVLDSTTVTLSGGPERVDLGFDVPASGASNADAEDRYVLQRGADEGIPLRRRFGQDGDWSTGDFDDETYTDPDIDFVQGTSNAASWSGDEPLGSWYYFFDWLVGPEEGRVMSPWSTDVDEIYMRPRDPVEEFDDVSPRALWIDTS